MTATGCWSTACGHADGPGPRSRDLGPSTQLRTWFGHDPARWGEFQARYHAELAVPERALALDALAERARHGPVTLVYGARDTQHNQARVIADELERRLA
jgi:uncharacterized protein YeaO (DUF488 family)